MYRHVQQKRVTAHTGNDKDCAMSANQVVVKGCVWVVGTNRRALLLTRDVEAEAEAGSGGSGSAKIPPLPLSHRREEWREKRNWFCYPSEKSK